MNLKSGHHYTARRSPLKRVHINFSLLSLLNDSVLFLVMAQFWGTFYNKNPQLSGKYQKINTKNSNFRLALCATKKAPDAWKQGI